MWCEEDGHSIQKFIRYDTGPLCAPLHGASASSNGLDITLFNPSTADYTNGHGTGHRVNEQTTRAASGGTTL